MQRGWCVGLAFAALATLAPAERAEAVEIAISCGAVGQELEMCRQGAEAWGKETGNTIKLVSTPTSATERLALYQQILAAGSGDIDVLQIDAIWPGLLASQMVDLKQFLKPEMVQAHLPAVIENNTVNNQLVAMPWFLDVGLLYYRKDLLEKHGKSVPKTWAELYSTAEAIQQAERGAGNDRMWGYVYQAKPYEGLTCNGLEWIDAFGGGTVVDESGKITVNNPNAAKGLAWAASTVRKISPEGVLNYEEEESRGVFQSGNAVFMRNWPYAWALAQSEGSAIKDKVGVASLPAGEGGKPTGALGGQNLAVSRFSAHPDVAADLVRYLTSQAEQKRRAVQGSFNPTVEALYKDEQVLGSAPFMGTLYQSLPTAALRPATATGARYNQVSAEFFGTVHRVLSGGAEAAPALADLERRLDRLSRGGRW